jgi:hypothetical protein
VASWAENQKAESAGQPHALLDGAFWQLNFKAVVLPKRPISAEQPQDGPR